MACLLAAPFPKPAPHGQYRPAERGPAYVITDVCVRYHTAIGGIVDLEQDRDLAAEKPTTTTGNEVSPMRLLRAPMLLSALAGGRILYVGPPRGLETGRSAGRSLPSRSMSALSGSRTAL
jgi:hypothetical protein